MGRPTDLEQLVVALRTGDVTPDEFARLVRLWSPETDPPLLDFLADQLPDSNSTATADQPSPTPASTGSLPGAGDPAAVTATEGPATGVSDRLPHPPPGGRYRVLRLHRAGGLGAVWVARDTLVGRDVALKTIRPDRPVGPVQVARFVREARVTGRLEHPGIVPLYDLPDTGPGGGGPCYVMRLVSGRTLAEEASAYHKARAAGRAGRLDLRALVDAFVAVGQAVMFAHSRGVLHRDLKGQNVVLGQFGEVFLLDWGLAKDDQAADVAGGTAAGSGSSEETQPGSVIGTPSFMAPEVAAGGAASRAADVYGLGGVLYQILTDHAPYDAGTPRDVLQKVTTTDPRPVRELNPAAPPALAAISHRALARDPSHRYASAEALTTDVRRWLADEPVTTYREPFAERAARWARRHRTGAVAAGVLAIATAIGSAITAGLVWREKERTATAWRHAEEERERAEANLDAAHRLTTGLVEVTEKLLPPVRGSELPRRDLTRAAAEMFAVFAGQRPEDPVIRRWSARLGVYDANLRRLVGDAAGADTAYRSAIDRLRGEPDAAADLAAALRDRAGFYSLTGRYAEADAGLAEADALIEQLERAEAPGRLRLSATLRLDRADLERARGRFAEASKAADAALTQLALLPKAGTDGANLYDPVLRAFALTAKSAAERERAGYAAALPPLRDAREQFKLLAADRTYGLNPDDVHFGQAVCEFEASRTWLRAEKDLKVAAEKNLGAVVTRFDDLVRRHPGIPLYRWWSVRARVDRGSLRAAIGKTAEARSDLEAARAAAGPLVEKYPDFPAYRAELGRADLGLARLAPDKTAATPLFLRAAESLRKAAAACPDDVETRSCLADAEAAR